LQVPSIDNKATVLQAQQKTNEQPRRKQRGISKQCQLMICMQFVVFITLVFDVSSNHLLISVFTDRTRKITVSPKLTAPQSLLHQGTTPEYLTSRQAFDECNDFGHAVRRH